MQIIEARSHRTYRQEQDQRASLIITCYNHARFLSDAIESALAQSRPFDEIILVNDGSTDETLAVAARFPCVRVITQSRSGLAAARNAGFTASVGEVIAFLDADDRLLPHALETGLRALIAHPQAAFVAGHHRFIDVNCKVTAEWQRAPVDADGYAALLRRNHIAMHAAVLYRRSALVETGGFDTSLGACEDYDLFLRIARKHPVHIHGELIAEYRKHGDNLSSDPYLMLAAALRVQRRHLGNVLMRPRYWRAFNEGRAFWKSYYGERIEAAVQQDLANRHHRRMLRGFWWLACYNRAGLARLCRPVLRALLTRLSQGRSPAVPRALPKFGAVRFGDLDRVVPISRVFGFDRGTPVDRYYVERFLAHHQSDIRGRTLEIGEDIYSRRFGGIRVERADILDISAKNRKATIVGDLSVSGTLPRDAFDCCIITQTLHLIFDMKAALEELHASLRPRGVLLLTVPGITSVDVRDYEGHWYWSLTEYAARRLCAPVFGEDAVEVTTHGNVYAATTFLQGMALEEIDQSKLMVRDPCYPVIVTVRAVKQGHA